MTKSVYDKLYNTNINNITKDDYNFFNKILKRRSTFLSVFTFPFEIAGFLILIYFMGVGFCSLGVPLEEAYLFMNNFIKPAGGFIATGLSITEILGLYADYKELSLRALGLTSKEFKEFKRAGGVKRIKLLVKEYEILSKNKQKPNKVDNDFKVVTRYTEQDFTAYKRENNIDISKSAVNNEENLENETTVE